MSFVDIAGGGHSAPSPGIAALVLAIAGLLVGAAIVFLTPRAVAYRLPEAPETAPAAVLLPLAGIAISRWRPRSSLLVEIGTAVVFGLLVVREGWSIRLLLACAYSAYLIAVAYIDIDYRLVLNRMSYPGAILALALSPLWPRLGFVSALEGALLAFVLFLVLQIAGRGALGSGDTKLAIVIGAMRGLPAVFTALVAGVVLGGIAAMIALLVLGKGRKSTFAYAPYLALGTILSFFLTGP